MDFFDWDKFNTSDNIDLSDIVASVPPFDAPIGSPQHHHASSSNAGDLRQAECGGTPSDDNAIQHAVPEDGSNKPTHPHPVNRPPLPTSEAIHNTAGTSSLSHNDHTSGQARNSICAREDVPERPVVLSRQNSGSGVRLSQEAVKILRAWLQDNALHPYPSELEKQELKRKTGLRKEQISNWLANARRRGKVPQVLPSPRNLSSGSYFNTPMASPVGVDVPRVGERQLFQDMSPLARWRNSPPEHEGAAAYAMSNAVAATGAYAEQPVLFSNNFAQLSPQDDGSGFSGYRTRSVSSIDTNGSSGSDFSQASHPSSQLRQSHRSGSSRRRRKKGFTRMKAATEDAPRPYQCTFCTDRFKTKYDWQRHEKTFHLSLERWRCAPHGPSQDGGITCVFCGQPDTSPQHFEGHNYACCAEQPAHARTFFRKDHLRQHLRLFHKECAYYAPMMDSWVTYNYEVRSRCGFCDSRLANWRERVEHLAAHFKEGKKIEEWKGDAGFEPHIERLVENSIPINTIAFEMKTVEPYSASNDSHRRTATLNADSTIHYSSAAQLDWLGLDDQLYAYVKEQLAKNHVPTDQEIQLQGRILVYGLDDPWNQTRADIPSWLESFKERVGLMSLPSAPGRNAYVGLEDGRAATVYPGAN